MQWAITTTLTIGITALALGAGAAEKVSPADHSSPKCEHITSSQKDQPNPRREFDFSRSTSSGARTGGKGSAPGSGFHANRVAGGPASGPHDAPIKSQPGKGSC
jgi:hypothetical protein